MTFPSSRFRRNRQPTLGGDTLRVRDKGVTAHNELEYARSQVMAACKRSGGLHAHWRKYTPEFNPGRCPVCYNPRTNTPVDENCPNCYGTGFDGGYSRPSVQYMIINHSDRRLEATPSGFVRMHRAISKSPYLPNVNIGDLIGEVRFLDGEYVIHDRFLVENVDRTRFVLPVESTETDTFDHLDPENEVVSYKFESTRIPKHSDELKRNIKYFVPFESPIWLTTTEGAG